MNAAARDKKWLALESDEARVESDPTRFPREQFVDAADGASVDKVFVLKAHARAEIHQAAELLGLQHESTDAPVNEDGSRQSPARWLVVAKSRSGVFSKISEIHRTAQCTLQRAKEALHEETKGPHQSVISRLMHLRSRVCGTWSVLDRFSLPALIMDGKPVPRHLSLRSIARKMAENLKSSSFLILSLLKGS